MAFAQQATSLPANPAPLSDAAAPGGEPNPTAEQSPASATPIDAASPSEPITDAPRTPTEFAEPSVQSPRRLAEFAPVWPNDVPKGAPVAVVLALTLDAEGHITQLDVLISAGDAFDTEAKRLALATPYEPGRREGTAVVTRFVEVVVFDASPRTATQAAPASPTAPEAAQPRAPTPVNSSPTAPSQDVWVSGQSRATQLRQSAASVDVVELDRERHRTSDLGEVLARKTSTVIRREAGLGSGGQLAIGGLGGDRVRFFIDGAPLEFSPYTQGLSNIPLNFIDRVEVYSGIVPLRFGADAIGGAIDVVTQQGVRRSGASGSYELGSFGTQRVHAGAQYFYPNWAGFVRAGVFLDYSDNSYDVDVQVPDDEGRQQSKRLPRFHDEYWGRGALLELGVVDKVWADRFSVQGHVSAYDKQLQSNPWMTRPYGEVTYGRDGFGANVRHAKTLNHASRMESSAGYARRSTQFRDLATCRYDWYGRCQLELPLAGEIASVATDRRFDDDAFFARSMFEVLAGTDHALRFVVAPTLTSRKGHDSRISETLFDELSQVRRLTSGVVGVEHESNWFDGLLTNVVFVKAYAQWLHASKQLAAGDVANVTNDHGLLGAGNNIRLFLANDLYIKAAYERAVHLPNADQVFGDGGLLQSNPDLLPERSHNANLGLHLDALPVPLGSVRAGVSTSARLIDDYFGTFSDGFSYSTANIAQVRALGAEANLGFTQQEELFGVDARASYLDVRNIEGRGSNALFEGDRLPNLPHLQGSSSAFARYPNLIHPDDHVELFWTLRYVRKYLLGWESAATAAARVEIPKQLVQGAGVTYVTRGPNGQLSSSLEVNNFTDERVYDFYGSQRPGRAFYLKLTFDTR